MVEEMGLEWRLGGGDGGWSDGLASETRWRRWGWGECLASETRWRRGSRVRVWLVRHGRGDGAGVSVWLVRLGAVKLSGGGGTRVNTDQEGCILD